MHENAGAPLVFLCLQALLDWLEVKLAKPIEEGEREEITINEESFKDHPEAEDTCEEDADESIRMATEEAFVMAGRIRNEGLAEELPQVELPSSARGVWRYTVGLVGKPSAGKSTFYNACTRAALEREGRLMAEVAPHPFTTIEPNIGPGWYASFDAIESSTDARRASLHGRDAKGRRLLPVIVKDVAGLVPGAYKGRGKGNRFLSDLCDADVLIHVVDASGQSDRDGNIIEGGIEGQRSSPLEDAQWVREELHRWIHGNVFAKWSSVGRKTKTGDRVAALFSGYKGPRACVERASRRAGLDIDDASLWSANDLHRIVAHYLSIRFPTCLALNKVDRLSSDDVTTVKMCHDEANRRGEAAIPVSARAESWQLLRQAAELRTDSPLASQLPAKGSKVWVENEHCLTEMRAKYGDTGVLDAISAAVNLRPPVLCYPVSDLATEAPVGWNASHGMSAPALRDCIQLKPGSTVGDLFDALKRGALDHAVISGDFVRAEGRALLTSEKKQLGRDVIIDKSNCVIRIQTNRKALSWQSAIVAP